MGGEVLSLITFPDKAVDAKIELSSERKIIKIIVGDEEVYSELMQALNQHPGFTTSCEPEENEKACFLIENEDYILSVILI